MTKSQLIVLVTIACTGAFLASAGGNHGVLPEMLVEHDHHLHGSTPNAAHDDVALHDVAVHAALHHPDATVDASTLAHDFGWTADWELRYVAAHEHGEVLHHVHAMHRHQRDVRYLSHWDAAHRAWSDWELAP